jgi:hypothetical protein
MTGPRVVSDTHAHVWVYGGILQPLQMEVEALKAELAALQAQLPSKASMEEVKGMQRDLVVQLWSMKGTGVTGPTPTKWESAAAVV